MSELSSDAAAYLVATRGSHSLTGAHPQLADAYQHTFDRLVKMLGAIFLVEIEPPPLVIVYSTIAHAETIVVHDQVHLVYDQYLGQILNRMNRLFFEDADPDEVTAYLQKIYAARSLAGGRPERALEHAIAYRLLEANLTRSGDEAAVRVRRSYTAWQETFVIAHELVHYIFRRYPRAAYTFQRYCLDLVAIVASQLKDADQMARIAAISETLVESRSRDDGPESVTPPSQLPSLFSFDMPVMGEVFGVDRFNAPTNAAVLEECVCDGAALLACSMVSLDGIHAADAACATFLGLHHLRLMRMVDSQIAESNPEDEDSPPMPRMIAETQYRFSFFRDMSNAWRRGPWSAFPEKTMQLMADFLDVGSLRMSLVEVNDRYDSIVTQSDTIATTYPQLHDALHASGNISAVIDKSEDTHDAVRRICDLPES